MTGGELVRAPLEGVVETSAEREARRDAFEEAVFAHVRDEYMRIAAEVAAAHPAWPDSVEGHATDAPA